MSSAVAMIGISRARATRMSQAMRDTKGARSAKGNLARKYCWTSMTRRQDVSRWNNAPLCIWASDLALHRLNQIGLHLDLAQGLAGLQAMQPADQHVALLVRTHQDRRLHSDLGDAFGQSLHLLGIDRTPFRRR